MQPRQLPTRHTRAAIIDVCELRTKTTDINWKVFQKFSGLTSELVQHRQDLLRFAQRENRDEDARAALESILECLCKPSLFAGPCPAPGLGVIASRTFHDQNIDLFSRKNRRFHDRLIVEIDVAGVKNGLVFRAEQNSCRAEHVPCIEKLERQRIFFTLGRAFASDGNALAYWTPTPAFRHPVGFPMCEKRIRPFSDFLALPGHHIDRVVQKHTANFSRGLRHKNPRGWKAPHRDR